MVRWGWRLGAGARTPGEDVISTVPTSECNKQSLIYRSDVIYLHLKWKGRNGIK